MQIKCGKTRIVFLIKDQAIKIGKVRPIRLFVRMVAFPFTSQRNHDRFYARYGSTLPRAVWRYLIAGLFANRNEYEYYQACRDCRVMPTVRKFLGGWVVIQHRGTAVSALELGLGNPFDVLETNPEFLERNQPWQFCRNSGGQIVLVDYGRRETCQALETTREIKKH